MPLTFWVSFAVIAIVLALFIVGPLIEGGYIPGFYFQVPHWIGLVIVVGGLIVAFAFGLGTNVQRTSDSYSIEWDGRSNPLRRH